MSSNTPKTPIPLYERVKHHILDGIRRGEWPDGARLPSEHELQALFSVSRMTVHRALRELGSEGLVSRLRGSGTFVTTPQPRPASLEIVDIAAEITARGHRHSMRLVKLETVRADAQLARIFAMRAGANLFHSVVVHQEDDVAVQLEERFVTPFFAPRYLEQDFSSVTTARYLEASAATTEVEHTVSSIRPDGKTRRMLNIDRDETCLRLTRRTWVGSVPATETFFTYPGSRYTLKSRYKLADVSRR